MSINASDPSHKQFLLGLGIFSGIAPESPALDRFIREIHLTQFVRGETIYRQGEQSLEIYLVRDGEIHLRQKLPDKKNRLIGKHGRGSLFGEVSFLNRGTHTTTAFVKLDSKVYCIPGKALIKLMEAEPIVSQAMARLISFRLHQVVRGDYKDQSPACVFSLFYPDDPKRGSALSHTLGEALALETGEPVLVLSLSRNTDFSGQAHLQYILDSWPKIKLGEILFQVAKEKSGFDYLNGSEIHNPDFPIDAFARLVPALLGRLKKYYTAILIDAGRHFENPAIARILSQSDRLILCRNPDAFPQVSLRWKALAEYAHRHFPGFPKGVVTISDEQNLNSSGRGWKTKDPFHSSQSSHFRILSHTTELEIAKKSNIFRKGLYRLARHLSGTSRGICFGGGGARALAHIGAIAIFEEEGIDFDAIAGSSMGAVIGAAWAHGLDAKQIAYRMERLIPNSDAILDKRLPLLSFYKGRKLERALQKSFGDLQFDELETPFFCNGCDLKTGRELVFEEGYVATALRASVSLPGVYPPYGLGQYRIVDGGVINNLPGKILRDKGYKRILGINVSPMIDHNASETGIEHRSGNLLEKIKDYFSVPPILRIINRSISIQASELLHTRLEDLDYIIRPNISDFDIFDFHRRQEILARGQQAARAAIPRLKERLMR